MIIDSSAVVAILRNEPEGPGFAHKIEQAPLRRISAASFVIAAIVVENGRALAKATAEPLLFKGSDFPDTDVTPA